jgi:hypothetical protein
VGAISNKTAFWAFYFHGRFSLSKGVGGILGHNQYDPQRTASHHPAVTLSQQRESRP